MVPLFYSVAVIAYTSALQAEGHGFEPQINHILGPSEGQPVAVNPVYMVRMKAGFDTGLGF